MRRRKVGALRTVILTLLRLHGPAGVPFRRRVGTVRRDQSTGRRGDGSVRTVIPEITARIVPTDGRRLQLIFILAERRRAGRDHQQGRLGSRRSGRLTRQGQRLRSRDRGDQTSGVIQNYRKIRASTSVRHGSHASVNTTDSPGMATCASSPAVASLIPPKPNPSNSFGPA